MRDAPTMNAHFETARDVLAHEQFRQEAFDLRQEEIKIETGQMETEDSSRILRVSRHGIHSQQAKDKKSRKDAAFTMLLAQMRKQLEELEQLMDELHADLEAKYGQGNVINGMAEAYLSPEILDGLETDEDKLKALADEFLNPDGTIKDKYKHLKEAQYVQAWQKEQQLSATLQKYESKADLTLTDKQDIYQTAENAGLSANKTYILEAARQDIASAIDAQVVDDRVQNDEVKISSNLTFGQN
jgi:hypothetical protein